MKIREFKARALRYYQKQGLKVFLYVILKRIWENYIFRKPDVLYCADLSDLSSKADQSTNKYRITERYNMEQMSDYEIECLCHHIGRSIFLHQLQERFQKKACLWLIYQENQLAGMIWSETENTIEPYYFPLAPRDVHLFDNLIFEEYRGRGINQILIDTVLHGLKGKKYARVYIETNWRNTAERRSLNKTEFQIIGVASVRRLFKKHFVTWNSKYEPHSLPERKK